MNSGVAWLSVGLVLFGCGRTSGDVTGVVRAEPGGAQSWRETSAVSQGTPSSKPSADPSRRLLAELAALPHRDVGESARVAPDCATPTSVGLSRGSSGTRAVRLVWDQETGDCVLEDVDRSPDGMLGILTLRIKDGRAALSSVGKWKFHAPKELELADVPARQSFTIYPYLDDWQFVATLKHNGEVVELLEFAYLRGEGPEAGGERQDLEDKTPSAFTPPTLCGPKPEAEEQR